MRFLDLVPLASGDDPNGWRAAWRERVRTEHAKLRRPWRVGDRVKLVGSRIGAESAPVVTITALKPRMLCDYFGMRYSLTRAVLKNAEAFEEVA